MIKKSTKKSSDQLFVPKLNHLFVNVVKHISIFKDYTNTKRSVQ